jgi:hypothetical protein
MAGINDQSRSGAGAGTPDTGGGTDGGSHSPPAERPQVERGGGQPASAPAGLSLDVIPESLRGLPAEQIRLALNQMVTGLPRLDAEIKRLREETERAKAAAAQPVPRAEEPDPDADIPLEELILKDPAKALDRWAERKFGSQLNRLDNIDKRVASTELATVAREIDDFEEYREDIETLLSQSGSPATREHILGAYTMAVGKKTLEAKARQGRTELNSDVPQNQAPQDEKKYNKTPLSEEIRQSLRMSEQAYYETFASKDNFQIKVPT